MHSFLKEVYKYPGLSAEDLDRIIEQHRLLEIPKGAFLLKEGQTARSYAILQSGNMRSFVLDPEGNEVTTDFFQPRDVVIEVASLFKQLPTQENFQALSDCTLWQIPFADFQQLFVTIPEFAEWGRNWMTTSLYQQKERMLNMLTKSAQERYLDLLGRQPEIIKEVALKHIASYLGVTDTSLSRIRKEIAHL